MSNGPLAPVEAPSPASAALEVVARRLLEVLGRVTGLESTYLTFVDWALGVQEILFARNTGGMVIPEGLRVEWDDTLCRRALEGGPACTSDVATLYPESAAARDLGIQTYLTAPIIGSDGVIFGTVCGASAMSVEVSETARLVLEALADMIALQLINEATAERLAHQSRLLSEANVELERISTIDDLTGVSNRRGFDRELARACTEAQRRGEFVSLLAVDIDEFKSINDSVGHPGGDAVLVAVADHLRAHARTEDFVGRVGGDELIVVLRNTDGARALRVAERLRDAICAVPIETASGSVSVSVSVGVASQRHPRPDELLRCADEALYVAKAAGRNAVAAAP